jgi:hypothetical protein
LQGGVGGAALGGVLYYYVAGEAAAVGQAFPFGVSGQEEAAQRHAEVVGIRDLEQSQHSFAFAYSHFARRDYFFTQREQAGLAGCQHQGEAVLAAKPTGPLQAAMIEAGFEAVANHGFRDQMG